MNTQVLALGFIVGLLITTSTSAQRPLSDPVYPAGLDAPMLARLVDARLADARAAVERLVAVRARRTAANTLRPFDDAVNAIQLGVVERPGRPQSSTGLSCESSERFRATTFRRFAQCCGRSSGSAARDLLESLPGPPVSAPVKC